MGLDVGERRIGVALSDESLVLATGLTTIHRRALAADLDALAALVAEHEVTALVVGWPLRLDGRPGPATRKIGQFADAVAERLGLPVERWDERLTTAAAERVLLEANVRRERRRQVVDKMAATLILQSYLDATRARRERPEGD
jgi:putative Holliday junction resolvase